MSYRPATIIELETYWRSKGGAALGIVGNQKHCGGYHLGRDRIYSSCACKPDGVNCVAGKGDADNSLRDARDRAGLTNAASALDLGRLNDSLPRLWEFSAWLADQCLAKASDCADIREVIFWSTERQRVVGATYRNGFSALVNDYGDLSHKTHTHISLGRDGEGRDKTAAFRRYFEPPSPPPVQEPTRMIGAKHFGPPIGTVVLGVGHQLISPVVPTKPEGRFAVAVSEPLVLNVYDRISLRGWPDRQPIDIDGNQPPLNERGECWVVDLPWFDDMALALVGDCGPLVPAAADATAAYNEGRDAVVAAANAVPRR